MSSFNKVEFLRLFGYKSLEDMPELPTLKEEDGQLELEEMQENKEDIEFTEIEKDEQKD